MRLVGPVSDVGWGVADVVTGQQCSGLGERVPAGTSRSLFDISDDRNTSER
jgi:hypothetical protein